MLPDPWLDEDTVPAGPGPSTLPDRAQLLEFVLSNVRSPATSGIVVAGDKGSGKSHLLLSLQAGLHETMDVRTFAGSLELKAAEYGVLKASANVLGPITETVPGTDALAGTGMLPGLHVFRALTNTLGQASYLYPGPATLLRNKRRNKRQNVAARPQLVVLVDDIHYVDPASLGVLLQLIPGFGAKLVATADSRHPLPQDLYQLWEDGFMEQYLLPPFNFMEAHALCVSLLGGKVQRRASSLLAAMSGFNVGILCLAVEDARRSGLLAQREGYWTINTRAHCNWPGVVKQVRAENDARSPEEQMALQLVALAEPLAADVVERHCGRKALENLLADHQVRFLPGPHPMLRMSSWLRGEGTRLAVPRSRSLALHQQVDGPVLTRQTAPSMLRWMTWTLDCGLGLADEFLLAAAPAADRPSTAELALKAAAAVTDPNHVEEAGMLRARALIAEGQLAEATPVLRRLAAAGSEAVKLDAGGRLMALELLGAVPPELPSGDLTAHPAVQIRAKVRKAEQLLVSGAAIEALAESTRAMKAVGQDPSMDTFRAGVLLRHVICLRHNLAWSSTGTLLEYSAFNVPLHLAECSEVARAYVQLSQGFPRAARATLEAVLAELSDAALPPVRSLAAAMMACCEALCGNLDAALERAKQAGNGSAGLLPQISALYVAAARDVVSGTSTHLQKLAEQFQRQGSVLLEAEALSLLALNATDIAVENPAALRRLATVASAIEGAGGAALRTFATALQKDEPKLLESAGRALSADRQFAHAALCYARAAAGYQAKERAAAGRRVSLLLERLRNVADGEALPPLGWVPGKAGT